MAAEQGLAAIHGIGITGFLVAPFPQFATPSQQSFRRTFEIKGEGAHPSFECQFRIWSFLDEISGRAWKYAGI